MKNLYNKKIALIKLYVTGQAIQVDGGMIMI